MVADKTSFQQGALAVFEQDENGVAETISRFLPFRFNPENLTRELTIEQAQSQGAGPEGAAADGNSADQGADADSGSLKEAFSITLRFDLAYRVEFDRSRDSEKIPAEYGVLPEISALEDLMYPASTAADLPSDGTEPTRARGRRPLVLFVWGERRVVPVKIIGMSINEQFFNGQLCPTRAEIEVNFEVLGEGNALANKRVAASMKFTSDNRRKMARVYLETTSSQGASISLPS